MKINIGEIFNLVTNSYDAKINELLNYNINYNLIEIKTNPNNNKMTPYDFIIINPTDQNYKEALNNFINNNNSMIPKNHKLIINDVYYYYSNNNHNKKALYAYPCGFEELNSQGKYPLLTAPFQINLHKKCKKHNNRYNNYYYTQVTILNDYNGEHFPYKNKLIFSAYISQTFSNALIQIIYILSRFIFFIKCKLKLPRINKINIFNIKDERLISILRKNEKKLLEKFFDYFKSKNDSIKLLIKLNV